MAKIKPIGDKILVQRVEAEEKSKGGILLPDASREKPREGIVKAVGKGRMLKNGKRAPFAVDPGCRVLFSSYAGTEVKDGGTEYLIMTEDEILAILT